MSKQKFKRKTLYTKTCVDNILRVYDAAGPEDRYDWYKSARDWANSLSESYGLQFLKSCGIIAALSPQVNWDHNKQLALDFISTGRARHTGMFVGKAEDIYHSDGTPSEIASVLNGNKITSFFFNIAFPSNTQAVTIDRHAQDVAIGEVGDNSRRQMTDRQYEFFSSCYRIAADKRGIPPYLMQSTTWVKWRKLKKEKQQENQKEYEEVPF